MKYFFIILFTLILNNVSSQTKRILVFDSLTHTPISNVLMKSHKVNLFSNINGEINLGNRSFDSISLTHSCCFNKNIKFNLLIDTIFLQRKPQELAEITVKSNLNYELFDIGYYNIGKQFNNIGILNFASTIAVFVPCNEEDIYIDKILLSIKSRQHAESYGVYLYQADSLGQPGEVLYKKKIMVDSLKKEGIINVRDLSIKIPENGIFIGLENFNIYDIENTDTGLRFNNSDIYTNKIYISFKDPKINTVKAWHPINNSSEINMSPRFGLRVYRK
jgi:hypothetical protein